MPQAKKRLISLVDTCYYHCVSRLLYLSSVFAIDSAATVSVPLL
jgi:hypothetical protein